MKIRFYNTTPTAEERQCPIVFQIEKMIEESFKAAQNVEEEEVTLEDGRRAIRMPFFRPGTEPKVVNFVKDSIRADVIRQLAANMSEMDPVEQCLEVEVECPRCGEKFFMRLTEGRTPEDQYLACPNDHEEDHEEEAGESHLCISCESERVDHPREMCAQCLRENHIEP